MAPHSSTLAWKIPWTEEPGRLQSMGSLRVGHDWATSLPFFTFLHWRRKWQPTPVFFPGESQGRGEPGGLPSMGLHRVGHDWSDLAAAAAVSCWYYILIILKFQLKSLVNVLQMNIFSVSNKWFEEVTQSFIYNYSSHIIFITMSAPVSIALYWSSMEPCPPCLAVHNTTNGKPKTTFP